MKKIVSLLIEEKSLSVKNKDHKLGGNFDECRECRIDPPEAPENLYYENIQLLKSAHLSECLKEKYKIYEECLAE